MLNKLMEALLSFSKSIGYTIEVPEKYWVKCYLLYDYLLYGSIFLHI